MIKRTVTRLGLLAAISTVSLASLVPSASAEFGVAGFDGYATSDALGTPFSQAGGHPHAVGTAIDFNARTETVQGQPVPWPDEQVKDIAVEVPPGLAGNPSVVDECLMEDLATKAPGDSPRCPAEAQVGSVALRTPFPGFPGDVATFPAPLYNVAPPPSAPARFGFNFENVVVTLAVALRSDGDYGLTVNSRGVSEALALLGSDVVLWGTPGDPAHDAERWCPEAPAPGCDSALAPEPLLTLPTACTPAGVGLENTLRASSWFDPDDVKTATFVTHDPPFYPTPGWPGQQQGPSGCEQVPFAGSFRAEPANPASPGPSGYAFDLTIPQADDPVTGIAPGHLKRAVVTLPEGVRVSPSSAQGLAGCSSAQIALDSLADPSCPDASKIGTVEVTTPLLSERQPDGKVLRDDDGNPVPDPLTGAVYLAAPHDNPSGSLLGLYIVVKGSGLIVKLPGSVAPDAETGQLSATFDNNPQLPFSNLHLELFGGDRAPLSNPRGCGTHTTRAELTSWSGETVVSESSFTTSRDGKGAPCPAPRFAPGFAAGTSNPIAGARSPFTLRLSRDDEDQELSGLTVKLPEGLIGHLKGVPYCPEPALAAISFAQGTGAAELSSPACPAQSQLGRVTVGAGAGPTPLYVDTGRAYLAGPYKGAPLSVAFVTPALAGPFDLGSVLVRAGLRVDRTTAQITAEADPLPSILHGISLQLRDVRVSVDRDRFVSNPTSCEEMSVDSRVTSTEGATATPSTRFQVGECGALGFKPRLSLRLFGGTKRGAHPRLRAVLRARPGDANIGRAQVALPRSAFLDQANIKTVCTRVQFAAGACPEGSVYGRAAAKTPLLDEVLRGPVYLRSSNNKLPDLVAVLRGPAHQPIEIELAGRIDSVGGGIRSTFAVVPDAPVEKFVLTMKGGRKQGLIVNSRNLCRGTRRATVALDAHSGKIRDFRPKVSAQCGKKRRAG